MPRRLYIALGLLSLIWGGSFFFIKVLLEDFGPWTIASLRASFGMMAIILITLFIRQSLHLRGIPWLPMSLAGLLNGAIPWSLIGISEESITSSMASVLNATTPLWTLMIGLTMFKAESNRFQWLGVGIGFIGLLVLLDINRTSIISIDLWGVLGMLLATFCYGLSSHLSKRYLSHLTMYQIAFGTLLTSCIFGGTVALITEPITFSELTSGKNLLTLVGLGMFGSGVAYVLYYYMIVEGSPQFASMVTYLVPGTAILWGTLLLNETIHWNLIAGLALILCGVFTANRKPTKTAEETGVKESPTA